MTGFPEAVAHRFLIVGCMIADDDLTELFAELCTTEVPIVPLAGLYSSCLDQGKTRQGRRASGYGSGGRGQGYCLLVAGYVLCEMEKRYVGGREPELRQRRSSQARKKRCEAGCRAHLHGDPEKRNFFAADTEQGSKSAGQLLDFRLQMRCSVANESA
jgi:hypothetical protein